MFSLKAKNPLVAFIIILLLIWGIVVYRRQVKQRISYLPTGHKVKLESPPYY